MKLQFTGYSQISMVNTWLVELAAETKKLVTKSFFLKNVIFVKKI